MVGVTGLEPATSSSRTTRASQLRYTPITKSQIPISKFQTMFNLQISNSKHYRNNNFILNLNIRIWNLVWNLPLGHELEAEWGFGHWKLISGATRRNRTGDPPLTRRLLYQLS
jgi:hypothetical protein